MAENTVVHIFNSLSEDVKKTLKDLANAVKVELAEEPAPAATEYYEVPLQDGTVLKVGGEVAVGSEVLVVTPEGELPAPEGEHTLADGSILVVKKEGEKSVIAEVKPAEEMKEEPKQTDVSMEAIKSLEAKFSALETENANLKNEIEKLKLSVSKTKVQLSKAVEVVEAMAAVPTDVPAKAPETIKVNKKAEAISRIFGK